MASLADHLKKQSEQGSSTYYNIDIIKYEVRVSDKRLNFFRVNVHPFVLL